MAMVGKLRVRGAAEMVVAMAMVVVMVMKGSKGEDGEQTWSNITSVMVDAGYLDNFVNLVRETGADEVFQRYANKGSEEMGSDETAGVTIFAPIDKAFDAKTQLIIANLSSEHKLKLALFHALPLWYAIGELQEESHLDEPTLASSTVNASTPTSKFSTPTSEFSIPSAKSSQSSYLLNITHNTGKVTISTSRSKASYTSSYYTQQPLSIVAITAVLLPPELFESPPPPPPPSNHHSSSPSQLPPPSFFFFFFFICVSLIRFM